MTESHSTPRMKESRYVMMCSTILGLANMLFFSGYDIQAFINESVLHSFHGREPERIGEFDGYFGQAIFSAVYCVSNLVVPSLLVCFGPKKLLVFGSCLMTLYFTSFIYLHRFTYFAACAALGHGFAVWASGYPAYLLEYSTRDTLGRNQAISWAISCMSYLCAGIGFIGLTFVTATTGDDDSAGFKGKEFSDPDVRKYYGACGASAILSIVLFCSLPTRRIEHSIAGGKERTGDGFFAQIAMMIRTLGHHRIRLLIPYYFYLGLFTPFYMSIIPTSMQFTHDLAVYRFLPAYYVLAYAGGIACMGTLTAFASRRIRDFGLKPVLCIHVAVDLAIYALILVSVPPHATTETIDERALLIQPNPYTSILLPFLFGVSDHGKNTARAVVTTLALPVKRAHAIAVSRFYHAIAGCTLFLLSPVMTTPAYVAGFATICVVSAALFWRTADVIRRQEDQIALTEKSSGEENIATENPRV